MKAVIIAGGRGARLRPLTDKIPKPLLPIGKKPILEIIIERLRKYGFVDIILNVKYKAESIKAYFHDGSNLNVKITYFEDDEPCGTAGPIKLVEHLLDDEPFLTMNGDLLTDLNFNDMYKAHLGNSAELTMATKRFSMKVPYGVLDMNNGNLLSIKEKPDVEFLINAGIYIVSPSALDIIPKNQYYDMPDLIQTLIQQGRKVETYYLDCEWQDIGTIENYNKAKAQATEDQ
jgi:NDP-sugar pyrophosphorylase family protein